MVRTDLEKILVLDLGGIGDVLLSLPAYKSLRQEFPQARIFFMGVPRVHELVTGLNIFDEIYLFDKKSRNPFVNLKNILILRWQRLNILINMRTLVSKDSAKKMRSLVRFIRARKTVGRNTAGRGDFFDLKIEEEDVGCKHELELNFDLIKTLGCPDVEKSIELDIHHRHFEKIDEIFKRYHLNESDQIIGVNLGGMPSRRWPLEYFAEFMENIDPKINAKFVVVGSDYEKELAVRLYERTVAKFINISGKLKFWELAAFIKRCDIFVTNDTGTMHLAAALKTRLVAIFGPGDLQRYDPRYLFSEVAVLYRKSECAPCNNFSCDDLKCLKMIHPGQVTAATHGLIYAHQKGGW